VSPPTSKARGLSLMKLTHHAAASYKDRLQLGHPIRESGRRGEVPPKRNRANLRRGNQYPGTHSRGPHTLILFSVRLGCSTKQRDTKDIPVARESILRFGEDGNPITELAQIRKLASFQFAVTDRSGRPHLMAADFKLGKVPGGIFVRWTLDVSERSLVSSNVALDIERYFDFALPSAPKFRRPSGIDTHTSRTRASGAIPRAPRNSNMVERPASWILKRSEKFEVQHVPNGEPLTAFNEICRWNVICHSNGKPHGNSERTIRTMMLFPYTSCARTAARSGPSSKTVTFSNLSGWRVSKWWISTSLRSS
jgi:hypothetical protein